MKIESTRVAYVKRVVAILFLTLTFALGYGQTTYIWIGAATGGVWGTGTNWSPNGIPATGDNLIFNIASNGTITAVPNGTVLNNVTINGAGNVTFNSTATANTLSFAGIVRVNNGGVVKGGAITLQFNAGSTYEHNRNAGSVPVCNWDIASNCNIIGVTTGATSLGTFSGQSYGNLTYNSPSQTGPQGLSHNGTATIIKGDLNIINTGSSLVALKNITTTAATLNVNGNLNISGGQFTALNAASTAATMTLTGDYIQTGGTFTPTTVALAPTLNFDGSFNQSAGIINQTSTSVTTFIFRGANKTYTQNGTFTNTNINFAINAANAALTLNSNYTISASRTFAVTSGALYCGTNIISGAGTFSITNSNTTTIGIGHQSGITSSGTIGNIQTTPARVFGAATNYIYIGTTGQVTGAGLPNVTGTGVTGSVTVALTDGGVLTFSGTNSPIIGATGTLKMVSGTVTNTITYSTGNTAVLEYAGIASQTTTDREFPASVGPGKLTLNNPSGVTLHAARVLPGTTDALKLTNGILYTSASSSLTTSNNAATVTGGSTTSYVSGPLSRTITGNATNLNFPVGKSAYQLFVINPIVSGSVVLTAEAFDANPGGSAGFGVASINTNRYWSLLASTNTVSAIGVTSLNETGLTAANHVCFSSTQAGIYNLWQSNIAGSTISTLTNVPVTVNASTNAYFVVGTAGTLSGTIQVGASGSIQKLYQIANLLNTNTLTSDVIFELQQDYDGTTAEIFPINFYPYAISGGTWSATVRPAAGVSMRTTSGGLGSVSMITWDGVDRLTFDGRAGGMGTAVSDNRWTIRNTASSSAFAVIKLMDDALSNTIQYCNIEGGNIITGTNAGLVHISTGITTGNDNNLIAYNRFAPLAATAYGTAIYSLGTSGTASNNDNTISNNHILNFVNGVDISGTGNGSNWIISNNSLFSTINTITGTTGISLISNVSTGNIITGNYIGGKAPLGGVASQPWVHTNGTFTGITVSASNGTASVITNNVIQNLSVTFTSTVFNGIIAGQGAVDVGTGAGMGNIIGHPSDPTLGISINSPSSAYGIINSGSNNCRILSNTVANITITGNATIGVLGIASGYASSTAVTINNNSVYSMSINGTGPLTGIGNGATAAASQTISGNIIHSLTSTNSSSTAVNVAGISISSSNVLANNHVKGNLIHSLTAASTNTASTIKGISTTGGAATYSNNMIRLGIDRNGLSITAAYSIIGIDHTSTATGGNAYYYNSVYVGGSNVASTATKTYAFKRTGTATLNISNNIFVNDRSNASTGGAHIAIGLSAITAVTSNNNLFNASGANGAQLFELGTTAYTTLPTWRTATSNQDLNSFAGAPGFINTTGNAAAVDLHINPSVPTQVEANAFSGTGINDDYDGDARTSPDIGADEGNFTPIDLSAPTITYTPIANTCNDVTTHTVAVNITDASGVNTTPGLAPRIYYKKASDATNAYSNNTSGTAGWKYVETASTSSPFSFTIDFNLINGGVTAGDAIQYVVVAQDMATPNPSNVGINSGSATFAGSPASVALASGGFPIGGTPNQFSILPCSGTVTVGTGGNYGVFTTANGIFNAINNTTLSGNLTITVVSDISTEDGSIPLNQWAENGSGPYSITIQSSNNTLRNISNSTGGGGTLGLFRMDGADRVIFNGGTSTNRYLKFSNVSNNSTFSFSNDATNITINNCIIEGIATAATNGVVFFGTTTGTIGNDNITITNCDIKDGATAPTNGIYAAGNITAGRENSNVTISNCNIYNFFNAAAASSGINLSTGNTAWNISGNRFFQGATRTTTGTAMHAGIRIINTSGVGFSITNNIIGGALANGTGIMTYAGGTTQLAGIYLNIGSSIQSNVTGNTISNLSFSTISGSTSGLGMFSGIYQLTGASNISNNTIGATTGTGAITVSNTSNASAAIVAGIRSEATVVTSTISNNNIGAITVNTNSTANSSVLLYGIYSLAGTTNVNGNTIGSATTANSIQANITATSNISTVTGIYTSASGLISVLNNQVNNLALLNSSVAAGTGGASTAIGLTASGGGVFTINNNTVSNITGNGSGTGVGANSAVLGISINSGGSQPHSITGNSVYNLSNANTISATATVATGIYFSGNSSTSSAVSKNLVYNISSNSSASSIINGIHINTLVTATNNMVRIGYNSAGASITTTSIIRGIFKDNTSASSIYHNTVYIGGTGVLSTANNTFAFVKTATSGNDNIRNNIFVNARANATSGGKHYAYWLGIVNGSTSNYNLCYAPSGVLFSLNGADQATLAGWKALSGNPDLNSAVADPNFVGATITTANLHLASPSPAEGAGIDIPVINDDIDGDIRANNTPVDMGADATIVVQQDIYPPYIAYTAIPLQAICASTVTSVQVTITDPGVGVSLSNNKPRMYIRKSVGTPTTAWGTYPSVEGVFTSGNNNVSVWNFTIDYAASGISVSPTDQFEYYFVAQDQATTPNVGYSQQNAATPVHNDVATQVTPPNFALSTAGVFTFANPLSGMVTVGISGTFATFNGPSGLFNALNTRGLNGNLIVEVISSITETTSTILGPIPEYCGTGYSILIKPDIATNRIVSNNASNAPVISLAGCKNITFNGLISGGKYLTIRQRQSYPAIYLNGSIVAATEFINIYNCNIESNNVGLENAVAMPGVIGLSGYNGVGSAIRDINITGNTISCRTDITAASSTSPDYLIHVGGELGNSLPLKSRINISRNDLSNFYTSAIWVRQNNSYGGIGDSIVIDSNDIYEPITYQEAQYAIWFEAANSKSNKITGNKIGGNARVGQTISGTWINNDNAGEFWGIYTLVGGTQAGEGVVVSNNTISNILLSGVGYVNFIGIRNEWGAASIKSNTIGSATAADNIRNYGNGDASDPSSSTATFGIWNQATEDCEISNNTIANITAYNGFNYVAAISHGSNYNFNYITYAQPAGKVAITDNNIFKINSYSGLQSIISSDALVGIFCFSQNGITNNAIDRNKIYSLNATNPIVRNVRIFGIGVGIGNVISSQGGSISGNVIYDLNNNASGTIPEISGIQLAMGNWNVVNNMISIDNSGYQSKSPSITGVYDWTRAGQVSNIYHNSIYIGGTVTAVSNINQSVAYYRFPQKQGTVNGSTVNLYNNIFFNNRTGNGTVNTTIVNRNELNLSQGWNSNYNFVAARDTNQLCYWNGLRAFSNWKTTSNGDANSVTAAIAGTSSATQVNPADLFTSIANGNLRINTSPPNSPYPFSFVRNAGTPITTVTTDIDTDPRDPLIPDLGCDEFTDCSTPVISMTANGVSGVSTICSGSGITLNVTPSGSGANCAGTYEYAISSGGLYWNGNAFTLSTPLYSSTYSSVSFVPTSAASYVAIIACSVDQTCRSNSNNVTVNVLGSVVSVNATIGTPANGASHYMVVSWPAVTSATGYDVEYSNNGSAWVNVASNLSATTFSHNTGDSPNVPTYYRVRSRNASITCNYTAMAIPVYTACDAPELPLVNGVTTNSVNVTLQTETPVANPSYTMYSIFCTTTNQYVQADGSLGTAEIFQTSFQWGTITVTGLILNTSYCFYAKVKNMDGDIRSGGNALIPIQQFNSNVFTQNGNLYNMWFAPDSYTPISYISSGGCSGGRAGYSGSFNNSWGNFIRTPEQNCAGMISIVVSFDLSNSYFATQTDDHIRFYMWDNYYTSGNHYYRASSIKVNGVEVSYTDINGIKLLFDQSRTCTHVEVTFDFNAVGYPLNHRDKTLFYLEPNCNYHNSNIFNVSFDNVSIKSITPTACATTISCIAPAITTQPVVPTALCANSGVATVSIAATGTGLMYQWRKNGSNIAIGGTYSVASTASGSILTITNPSATDAGSYDVIVSGQCSPPVTSNAVLLTVNTAISGLVVNANSPVCEGFDLTLSGGVSTGTGISWAWSGPGFSANTQSPILTGILEASNEGMYTVTASNVCNTVSGNTSVNVHGNIIGLVANTNVIQICTIDTLLLTATYIGNQLPGTDVQWSWTGPNGFTANTQNTFRASMSSSDDGTYDVFATNGCGVQSVGSANIIVDEFMEADAGPDGVTNVCGTLTAQLNGNTYGAGSGAWSEISSGNTSFNPSNTDSNAVVTADGYGLKQYRWTITNGACISEDDVRYYFNPAITATVDLAGCNFTNADSVFINVTASGGSSTLAIDPPLGNELKLDINGTKVYTSPMDGVQRTYTISDGICTLSANVTSPMGHPTDIPYVSTNGTITADCYDNSFTKWLTFRDINNDAILSVNDNGQNLDKISASVYRDVTEPIITQLSSGACQGVEQLAMKRHFVLKSNAAQPFASDVSVRLYFSEAELNDLVAATQANDIAGDECTQYDNLTGLSDLYVTKYTGADEDGDYINNSPSGIYRVYTSDDGTLQPSANGFPTIFTNGQNHHYVELNVREFSELWLHGSSTGSALPVEMIYLNAEGINNEYIKLTWATALEINNNGFVIERSIDAEHWESIGWVDGHNNATTQNDYAYDDHTVSHNIRYYYRLRQVDNDGAYEYTGLVSAIISAAESVLTVKDFIPNPALNSTTLVVVSPAVQNIQLDIYNAIGQKIYDNVLGLVKGSNSTVLNVSEWAAGTYTAFVQFNNEVYSKKLVITK